MYYNARYKTRNVKWSFVQSRCEPTRYNTVGTSVEWNGRTPLAKCTLSDSACNTTAYNAHTLEQFNKVFPIVGYNGNNRNNMWSDVVVCAARVLRVVEPRRAGLELPRGRRVAAAAVMRKCVCDTTDLT